MVRTLSNAFETGRIPQAWMLTGRARRRQDHDGPHPGPRPQLPDRGRTARQTHPLRPSICRSSASTARRSWNRATWTCSRWTPPRTPASTTSARSSTASATPRSAARYKVYIIDEVHMLSEKAFNAFLKTLEEPPPHAKFVFATTEIRKVPVTILSRCQRFDLRRIEADKLVAHLARICAAEGVEANAGGARLHRPRGGRLGARLALAAGSGHRPRRRRRDRRDRARHAGPRRPRAGHRPLRGGRWAATCRRPSPDLRAQYDAGADPAVILSDLAAFSHVVTRLKLIPDAARDPALTEAERRRGAAFARKLSVRTLSRAWQILLKGIPEVQGATRPVGGGRDGAGAARLCRRPADAGRGPARPSRRRGPHRGLRHVPGRPPRRLHRDPSSEQSRAWPRRSRGRSRGRTPRRRPAGRAPAPVRGCGGAWPASSAKSCSSELLSATSGSCASRRGASSSASSKAASRTLAERSLAGLQAMDGAALDRGTVVGAGRADAPRAGARGRRANARRARPPIRSSRPSSPSFPVPRSSTSSIGRR